MAAIAVYDDLAGINAPVSDHQVGGVMVLTAGLHADLSLIHIYLRTDVAVIGAGITGILTASKLQKTGKEVVLLEANRIASGQTGKTTAKITSQHGLLYHRLIQDDGCLLYTSSGVLDSSLQFHIQSARNHGVTAEEMAEILTHAAFYGGWLKAWAAFRMAKEVYGQE